MHAIFQKEGKKCLKRGKKEENNWKFGQKYTKFENILKMGKWLCVIIACIKLLDKTLITPVEKDLEMKQHIIIIFSVNQLTRIKIKLPFL